MVLEAFEYDAEQSLRTAVRLFDDASGYAGATSAAVMEDCMFVLLSARSGP